MIKEKKQWKDNRDLPPEIYNVQKMLREAANVIADSGDYRIMLNVLAQTTKNINDLLLHMARDINNNQQPN
jgi:GTP1/Obg family GTP-binding protein